MNYRNLLLASAIVSTVSACAGTDFSWNNVRQLKLGMTPTEVTSIMGKPMMITTRNEKTIWIWSFATGFGSVKSVSVGFTGEQVTDLPAVPSTF